MKRLLVFATIVAPAAADEALVERWNKPRRESFAFEDELPAKVAEEVSKRFGIPFEAGGLLEVRGEFHAKDATFFEVLDRFAAAHGLLVAGWPGEAARRRAAVFLPRTRGLALVRPEAPGPVPVVHMGPSRFSVSGVSVLAEREWARDEAEDFPGGADLGALFNDLAAIPRLRIAFRWVVEPGFEDVTLVACEVRHLEDDTGTGRAVLRPPNLPCPANDEFSIDFAPPPRRARTITRLEGRLRVALPLRGSRVEFQAAEVGMTKQLGGAQLRLDDIEDATVRITLKGPPASPLMARSESPDLHVGRASTPTARDLRLAAYRADGTEIAGSKGHQYTHVDGGCWTYRIDLHEPPARLVVEATTEALVREIPFAFGVIPLPD
jgi:hypothetical protein